jgi:Uma2 family endonuclease
MTIADEIELPAIEHLVLENASWELYEQLRRETEDRHLQITYDQGRLEIMSPFARHESYGNWIGRLIDLMCLERGIRIASLRSTTFKSKRKRKGLEPDQCYYIQHVDAGLELSNLDEEFDASKHSVPDLALEIDLTSRSVPREPIYAGLNVRELWRFDARKLKLTVLHLGANKEYAERKRSLAFPFLPIPQLQKFIQRIGDRDQLGTLREFQNWVRSLPNPK